MRPEIVEFKDKLPATMFVRNVEYYPYHWHDILEIVVVLKGSINLIIGDESLLLHKNDIALVNIDEMHRMDNYGEGNEVLSIHIDGSFCRRILKDRAFLYLYCCSPYHEAATPGKYQQMKTYIAQLVQVVYKIKSLDTPDMFYSAEQLLISMIKYMDYHFDFLRWGYGTTPFSEKIVNRLKFIAEKTSNDQEMLSGLSGLASELNISLQHLSHDIKEKFGLTFQELLYYSKCEQAAKLLLSTCKRIIDISMDCGFSDAKYLIKYFKRYFNCTPSEFRKKHLADNKIVPDRIYYRDCPLSDAID